MNKSVLFCENQLGYRGTSVALFDYAVGNEDILGNKSFIAAPINGELTSLEKFQEYFRERLFLYEDFNDLQAFVDDEKIDVVYQIISGEDTSKKLLNTKNVYHAVFNVKNPEITAYVSSWLADQHPGSKYCPHIVSLPDIKDNYREQLGIPIDAFVYGRLGGYDQFDLPYVSDVIKAVVEQRPNTYFLFMNTAPLNFDHPNVWNIGATTDVESKTGFINTCDVMIHSRSDGESFGLSICEFLHQNKPVITNSDGRDKNHLRILGPAGYYYESANELYSILTNFQKKDFDYRSLVAEFSPARVMKQFEQTFLL